MEYETKDEWGKHLFIPDEALTSTLGAEIFLPRKGIRDKGEKWGGKKKRNGKRNMAADD
jgi:hypothetical protein